MVKVYVIKRAGRKNYVCQWEDPVTGRMKMQSTGTPNRREADKIAGQIELKLQAGEDVAPIYTEWSRIDVNQATGERKAVGLADRYEAEVLQGKSPRTLYKFQAIRKHVERLINPKYVTVLTSPRMAEFQGQLRSEQMAEATIKSSLSALRACLNWGKKIDLIAKVPHIVMPTRCRKMKGRPISFPEFSTMLNCVADEVGESYAPSVKDMMVGLWLSGLRIEEALRLTWEPTADGFNLDVDADGTIRIKIEALSDKSTEARYLPLLPDCQRYLASTPMENRHGFVFNPRIAKQKIGSRMRADTCSKLISRIGKSAKIVVAFNPARPGDTEPRKKFASAHDFRRSFAERCTEVLTDEQLMEVMRHKDIETTRDHYAKRKAQQAEKALNAAMQRISDNPSDILPFRRTA